MQNFVRPETSDKVFFLKWQILSMSSAEYLVKAERSKRIRMFYFDNILFKNYRDTYSRAFNNSMLNSKFIVA